MNKFKNTILAFLISCLFVQSVNANDDSCTQTDSIMVAILDITTLGLFDAYSTYFHMYGAGYGSGSDGTNGCLADYYPDNCTYSEDAATGEGSSNCSGSAYLHNSSYCQPDGTNCCQEDLTCTTDSTTNVTTCLPTTSDNIGVACSSGNATNKCFVNGDWVDCGECNPDGGLEFCYDNYDIADPLNTNLICNGTGDPIWGQNGDYAWYFYPPGQLQIAIVGDKLCAQFDTTLGYQSIGCKYRPSCSQFYLNQSCYVADSCSSYSAQKSLALLPVTAAIIQCVNDTIQFVFYGNPGCNSTNDPDKEYEVTKLSDFQGGMRSMVRIGLFLYLVIFGLKTVLSAELPSKGEFFKMGAKFILVMYFSTGININGVVGSDGQPYYDQGLENIVIPLFTQGAAELADMVYSSGGSSGLCIYPQDKYPSGYGYLSMWDGLDCRILYYLGVNLSAFAEGGSLTMDFFSSPTIMGLILPAFFAFEIIFLICSVVFVVMFVSVLIYFVNLTVISTIVVAILIYMGPLFIPMALFDSTKGYYDGWLKTTAAFALQPMVIAAYFAMMFTIFDQTIFGDCVFNNSNVNFQMGSTVKELPFFMLCDPHDSTGDCYGCTDNSCTDYQTAVDTSNENITTCNQTIGYFLNPISASANSFTYEVSMIFFNIYLLNSNIAINMTTGMVTLCLFGYLFYKFGDVIEEFANELTGESVGGTAGKPMAGVEKAKEAMKRKPPDKSDSNAKASSTSAKRK